MTCARLVLLVRCSTCCVHFACRQTGCQVCRPLQALNIRTPPLCSLGNQSQSSTTGRGTDAVEVVKALDHERGGAVPSPSERTPVPGGDPPAHQHGPEPSGNTCDRACMLATLYLFLVGLDQKDICTARVAATMSVACSRLCSLRFSVCRHARHHCWFCGSGSARRRPRQLHVLGLFCWFRSISVFLRYRHHGWCGRGRARRRQLWHARSVLLVTMQLALCSFAVTSVMGLRHFIDRVMKV